MGCRHGVEGACTACGAANALGNAERMATRDEKARIVQKLLRQADEHHEARNYHDRDRYRDAAWLVERA
jgi:hypothetical protein